MGLPVSKVAGVGALTAFGVAGVGLGLYLQYMQDCKEYDQLLNETEAKEKYMFTTFGEGIKIYMEECKEEITTLDDTNLCLSIHFFWNYFSILDLMMLKSAEEVSLDKKKTRITFFQKFQFSDHTKAVTEVVKAKLRKLKENMAILNHVLGIKDELLEASRIHLIRTNPTAFVEMTIVGPDSRNKRRMEQAPDFLNLKDEIIKYIMNNIEERIKRGFNSVDTSLFEESFAESLDDELQVKFGINFEHFMGFSLKHIDLEHEIHIENVQTKYNHKEHPWNNDKLENEYNIKFSEMIGNYILMLKKMYESMTLYKPGLRLGKAQIAQMQETIQNS